jgi:hypothetical protein
MVFRTPTQEQINRLEEKRLILLKALSKDDERISNCPNNRQEIKVSDFRDVLTFDALLQLGGSPLLFMAGSFIQGR